MESPAEGGSKCECSPSREEEGVPVASGGNRASDEARVAPAKLAAAIARRGGGCSGDGVRLEIGGGGGAR